MREAGLDVPPAPDIHSLPVEHASMNSINRVPKQRRFASLLSLSILVSCSAMSQMTESPTEGETQQLIINADGSINYYEPFGPKHESLLEYRTKPRPTIDLISLNDGEQRKVTIYDYDKNGTPDFIHLEHIFVDGSTDMVGLYRGPGHKLHEEGHLDHALKHHFIHRDSASAQQLRERLAAIRARTIPESEVGIFSGYGLFAGLRLPSIVSAFEAADSLAQGITILTGRSLNEHGRIPNLAAQHADAIGVLLTLDPHNLAPEAAPGQPKPIAPAVEHEH